MRKGGRGEGGGKGIYARSVNLFKAEKSGGEAELRYRGMLSLLLLLVVVLPDVEYYAVAAVGGEGETHP